MFAVLLLISLVANFSLGGRGDGGGGRMGGFTFDTNLASMHTYLGGTFRFAVSLMTFISHVISFILLGFVGTGSCSIFVIGLFI